MAEVPPERASAAWPVFRSLASFRPIDLPSDLIAGLTLAAIAIPEQMATARLGGFPPQIGFFAFIAGSFGFAVLGSNRFLSCGANSTITPIFAAGLMLMAASGSPDYQALAAALALMVGTILVVGGLFRLGWIANLLSTPVMVGFLAGISVHILVSQMPVVLGLASPSGPMLYRMSELARHLGEANVYTVCIGLGVLGVVAGSEAVSARIPGALIGLVAATIAAIWAGLESKGVSVVGTVPGTLPTPSLPDISLEQWARLLTLSFLIAIVVMVQTAATTRSFPSDPDKPADVDRDFLGAGAGSILAGLFGAFPGRTPARRGPASSPRPADGHNYPGCSLPRSCSRCWRSARRCCSTFRTRRSAAFCCSSRCGSFASGKIAIVYRQSIGEFFLIVATAAAIIVLPIEQGVAVGIALLAAARHLEHDARATRRLRARARHHVWWPANPTHAGRAQSEPWPRRPASAAFISQRGEFPRRRTGRS